MNTVHVEEGATYILRLLFQKDFSASCVEQRLTTGPRAGRKHSSEARVNGGVILNDGSWGEVDGLRSFGAC